MCPCICNVIVPADRNFKGPWCTLGHVQYRQKTRHRGSPSGLGLVGGKRESVVSHRPRGVYIGYERPIWKPAQIALRRLLASIISRGGSFFRFRLLDPKNSLQLLRSLLHLSFPPNVDRVAIGAPKRPYTAPTEIEPFEESPNPLIPMARREGFDASLRSLVEPTSAQSKTGRLRHSMAKFEMARREGFASQRSGRCLVGPWPTETPDPQVRRIIRG